MPDLTLSAAMDTFLAEEDPTQVFLPLAGGTMDAGADINFANASRLREGLTDAGEGGAKGIAMVCSLDYEFKWEAGRLYVMGQDGFTIRVEQYGFTSVPTTTDDDTKGYIVGSRRILDDGSIYLCTDATEDAAVWLALYDNTTEYVRSNDGDHIMDLNNKHLVDGSNTSVDWGSRLLTDSATLTSVDWENRQLIGADGTTVAANWANGIYFPTGLGDASGVQSIDTSSRALVNEDGTPIASWSTIDGLIGLGLGDSQRYIGIDSTLRFYDGTAHVDMVDWSYGLLRKSVGGGVAATTVDWVNSQLLDDYGAVTADWSDGLTVGAVTETLGTIGVVTTSHTLDISAQTILSATLTASDSCAFAMPPLVAGKSFRLLLHQDSTTGGGSATFTDVKFAGSTAPTITATAGRMDILTFVCDGTNWYGTIAQDFTP